MHRTGIRRATVQSGRRAGDRGRFLMAVSLLLQQALNRYGLGSLLDWASEALVQGWSEDQIMLELYNRPEFNARFPAIKVRETKGLPPITPEDYLNYEQGVYALNAQWGMNITKQQIDTMIGNNKSFREAEEVVSIAAAAVFEDTSETRQSLARLYPEITHGDLITYWMNPSANLGTLQTKYRASQLAGAGLSASYGELTQQQAERLVQAGLDRSSALSGFAELVANEDLFRSTIGTEEDIGQDQQIELLAGNADIAQQVKRRAESRLAEYEGSSTFAAGQEGFAVGSAPR